MWDDLRGQVMLEREQLHKLIESCRPLLDRCAVRPPAEVELYSLAAVLHSFYNGVENIFKRITKELGDQLPKGNAWHRELLDSMGQPRPARRSVLSPALIERLDTYLDFRHFFRHAYVFNLQWDRMKSLALACEETLKLVESELEQFFAAGSGH